MEFKTLREYKALDEAILNTLAQDKDSICKLAAANPSFVSKLIAPVLTLAGGIGLASGASYLSAKRKEKEHRNAMQNSYDALLMGNPEYQNNMGAFTTRFQELLHISPTVAANPALAHKVIQPRMEHGFDLDDVHRLSAIEYHAGLSPKVQDPLTVAQNSAIGTMSSWVHALGPSFILRATAPAIGQAASQSAPSKKQNLGISQAELERIRKRQDKTDRQIKNNVKTTEKIKDTFEQVNKNLTDVAPFASDVQNMRPMTPEEAAQHGAHFKDVLLAAAKRAREQRELEKKSSASELLVSEECLGRMIADRYTMYKTATKKLGAPTGLGKGMSALGNYFHVAGPALAIAGGMKLISDAMKRKETTALRMQADEVFAHLKKNSEYVKDNPILANEAFDTLRTFAPSMAAKPIIARSFIENVVKSGVLHVDTANTLAKTEELVNSVNQQTGGEGFIEGLKTPMSLFSYGFGKGKKD